MGLSLGPYARPGGGAFSYERGTPVRGSVARRAASGDKKPFVVTAHTMGRTGWIVRLVETHNRRSVFDARARRGWEVVGPAF